MEEGRRPAGWQVDRVLLVLKLRLELFFKWIKQNLRIRHFYGTSENAVKTQIWTAVCVYVLAAIVKKELALDVSLYTFLQVLSVHSFERIPILQVRSRAVPAATRGLPRRRRGKVLWLSRIGGLRGLR